MKIYNPARWGIVLALLSTPLAVVVGQAPEEAAEFITEKKIKCKSHDECLVYCASDGYCEPTGGCATVEDCAVEENQGYLLDACIGKPTCENRKCGIKCGDFSKPETCGSHSECTGNQYCASDGVCEKIGGCATVDDCGLEENQGYPIALCIGNMQCINRECGMNCSGGSDALFACQTSEECSERDTYCNNYEFCSKNGSCITDEDCSMPGNNFMEIECVGTRYCSETGMCAKTCNGNESSPLTCNASSDCSDGEYCAGNGVCLAFGECDKEGDCTNTGNEIMFIACVGTITCELGQCGKTCGGSESPPKCTSSSDCSDGEYCTGNGVCLEMGWCDQAEDCTNFGNEIMFPACVGTITCESGQCGKTCDGAESPPKCKSSSDCSDGEYCAGNGVCLEIGWCNQAEDCTKLSGDEFMFPTCVGTITCESGMCGKTCDDNESAVDIDIFCTSDDECNNSITTATTRSAPGETLYCAQGVCKKQGSCVSDNDCMNPSNILWNDKRCMGYLHCRDGLCDRECGVDCKNGSKAAQCFTDPCEVDDWESRDGAVSCRMTTCDGGCDLILFDTGGHVLPDYALEPDMNGETMAKDNSGEDLVTPGADTETTQATNLKDSPAVRATSVFAILVASLLAAVMA